MQPNFENIQAHYDLSDEFFGLFQDPTRKYSCAYFTGPNTTLSEAQIADVDLNLDQIENREALRPLLAALPDRERTVLILRFFDSLTQTQIAERVGISQMHVSRLLARSLAQLRQELI